MSLRTPDSATLAARLDRLERRNRLLWGGLAVLAAVVLVSVAVTITQASRGPVPPGDGTVGAEEFLLRDKDGLRYASLRIEREHYQEEGRPWKVDAHPVLEFYGEHGMPRLQVTAGRHGTNFFLSDKEATSVVGFAVSRGYTGLTLGDAPLADKQGKRFAVLVVDEEGAGLEFLDSRGPNVADAVGRVKLFLSKDGPSFNLYDEKGKALFSKP
jgi:hypothetical protein